MYKTCTISSEVYVNFFFVPRLMGTNADSTKTATVIRHNLTGGILEYCLNMRFFIKLKKKISRRKIKLCTFFLCRTFHVLYSSIFFIKGREKKKPIK